MPQSKMLRIVHFKVILLMQVISALARHGELQDILQSDEEERSAISKVSPLIFSSHRSPESQEPYNRGSSNRVMAPSPFNYSQHPISQLRARLISFGSRRLQNMFRVDILIDGMPDKVVEKRM
jgi:hypothetical protein